VWSDSLPDAAAAGWERTGWQVLVVVGTVEVVLGVCLGSTVLLFQTDKLSAASSERRS
jgi:hypothetical protein